MYLAVALFKLTIFIIFCKKYRNNWLNMVLIWEIQNIYLKLDFFNKNRFSINIYQNNKCIYDELLVGFLYQFNKLCYCGNFVLTFIFSTHFKIIFLKLGLEFYFYFHFPSTLWWKEIWIAVDCSLDNCWISNCKILLCSCFNYSNKSPLKYFMSVIVWCVGDTEF